MVSPPLYPDQDDAVPVAHRRYPRTFSPYMAIPDFQDAGGGRRASAARDNRVYVTNRGGGRTGLPQEPAERDPPVRKRIAVACARCRKRKIRCTGDPGQGLPCVNCKNAGVAECLFLRVSSRETPIKNNGCIAQSGDFEYNMALSRALATRTTMPAPSYAGLDFGMTSSFYPAATATTATRPYYQPVPAIGWHDGSTSAGGTTSYGSDYPYLSPSPYAVLEPGPAPAVALTPYPLSGSGNGNGNGNGRSASSGSGRVKQLDPALPMLSSSGSGNGGGSGSGNTTGTHSISRALEGPKGTTTTTSVASSSSSSSSSSSVDNGTHSTTITATTATTATADSTAALVHRPADGTEADTASSLPRTDSYVRVEQALAPMASSAYVKAEPAPETLPVQGSQLAHHQHHHHHHMAATMPPMYYDPHGSHSHASTIPSVLPYPERAPAMTYPTRAKQPQDLSRYGSQQQQQQHTQTQTQAPTQQHETVLYCHSGHGSQPDLHHYGSQQPQPQSQQQQQDTLPYSHSHHDSQQDLTHGHARGSSHRTYSPGGGSTSSSKNRDKHHHSHTHHPLPPMPMTPPVYDSHPHAHPYLQETSFSQSVAAASLYYKPSDASTPDSYYKTEAPEGYYKQAPEAYYKTASTESVATQPSRTPSAASLASVAATQAQAQAQTTSGVQTQTLQVQTSRSNLYGGAESTGADAVAETASKKLEYAEYKAERGE